MSDYPKGPPFSGFDVCPGCGSDVNACFCEAPSVRAPAVVAPPDSDRAADNVLVDRVAGEARRAFFSQDYNSDGEAWRASARAAIAGVSDSVIQDVCDLNPGDYSDDAPDTLRVSVRDLRTILERHLVGSERRADSERKHLVHCPCHSDHQVCICRADSETGGTTHGQ